MKKIVCLVLVIIMIFALSSCAGVPKNENTPTNNVQNESRFIHDITPTANSSGVERWEYMRFEGGSREDSTMEYLNELGLEGWELVSFNFPVNSNVSYQIFILKRRLP